jgi:hypothetical protein
LGEHFIFLLIYSNFLNYFALWIFEKKNNNINLYEYILQGAELFRQQPNFLVDLARSWHHCGPVHR